MPRRIDYHHSPDAPPANSIVPSANVVVINDAGEILLIRRSDNDNWAVPGGAVDLGESLPHAAIRETKEESGIDCEITGISGIYTDPQARDPLHQQRRGPPGVLHRPYRAGNWRRAYAQLRVVRGPLGRPR